MITRVTRLRRSKRTSLVIPDLFFFMARIISDFADDGSTGATTKRENDDAFQEFGKGEESLSSPFST
jgi:hypothetical protein